MPLPLLLPHAPGETPVSFLSRLAMCNGTTAAGLASDLGFSLTDIIDAAPDAIAKLADHTEALKADLSAAGYRKIKTRSYLRNDILLPRDAVKSPTTRGCPACLREDARRTGVATQICMAIRADWQMPFLRTCPSHDRPLISLWIDQNRTARYDVAVRLGLLFDPIMTGELDRPTREHSPFEAWVVHRINGAKGLHWFNASRIGCEAVASNTSHASEISSPAGGTKPAAASALRRRTVPIPVSFDAVRTECRRRLVTGTPST